MIPNRLSPQLKELTWTAVAERINMGKRSILLSVASLEQHGPHLPLITDTLLGEYVADRVAYILGDVIVAPSIHLGESTHHMMFPGTVSIGKSLMLDLVRANISSFVSHGFTEIFVVASHGGNYGPLSELQSELQANPIPGVRVIFHCDLMADVQNIYSIGEQNGISPNINGGHAGESETSMVLALRPDLVNMSVAQTGFTGDVDGEVVDRLMTGGMAAISENGIIGDATYANAERGQIYLDGVVEHISSVLSAQRASEPAQ